MTNQIMTKLLAMIKTRVMDTWLVIVYSIVMGIGLYFLPYKFVLILSSIILVLLTFSGYTVLRQFIKMKWSDSHTIEDAGLPSGQSLVDHRPQKTSYLTVIPTYGKDKFYLGWVNYIILAIFLLLGVTILFTQIPFERLHFPVFTDKAPQFKIPEVAESSINEFKETLDPIRQFILDHFGYSGLYAAYLCVATIGLLLAYKLIKFSFQLIFFVAIPSILAAFVLTLFLPFSFVYLLPATFAIFCLGLLIRTTVFSGR